MNRYLVILAWLTFTVTVLTLTACDVQGGTPSVSTDRFLSPLETQASLATPCEICAQATLASLRSQQMSNVDADAAATAEILRADAQATLDASSSTLSAALTQEQNNTNIIAAQVAATAAIVRANAQATLMAAGSTQGAALTQDAILQTQMAGLATADAAATSNQQNKDELAASTQTAVANLIATQTQSAVATSQWYADQERQREEQRQVPLTFLWMWCPPLLIVATALVGLLFFWRWMRIRETQQLIDMQPAAPAIIEHQPRQIIDIANHQYPPAKPQDHVRKWLEEVKHKLITDKRDDNDNPGR